MNALEKDNLFTSEALKLGDLYWQNQRFHSLISILIRQWNRKAKPWSCHGEIVPPLWVIFLPHINCANVLVTQDKSCITNHRCNCSCHWTKWLDCRKICTLFCKCWWSDCENEVQTCEEWGNSGIALTLWKMTIIGPCVSWLACKTWLFYCDNFRMTSWNATKFSHLVHLWNCIATFDNDHCWAMCQPTSLEIYAFVWWFNPDKI